MGKNKPQGINIFIIFFRAIWLYTKHILILSKVTIIPLLGIIAGIVWIFGIAFYMAHNISNYISLQSVSGILTYFLALIMITLPGFVIFIKSFWEYTILLVSLNSIIGNLTRQNSIKDIKIHNQAVKLKSREFIILLTLLTIIYAVGFAVPVAFFSFPVLASKLNISLEPIISLSFIFLGIISLLVFLVILNYLSLCFQIFAFENMSAFKILKKSWSLVEGNFWKILFLGIFIFILVNFAIPEFIMALIEKTPLITFISAPFQNYVNTLAQNPAINAQPSLISYLNTIDISKNIALMLIGSTITMFLLPLGSACYTLAYFDIVNMRNIKKSHKNV